MSAQNTGSIPIAPIQIKALNQNESQYHGLLRLFQNSLLVKGSSSNETVMDPPTAEKDYSYMLTDPFFNGGYFDTNNGTDYD